jgi:hypothetical protein
MADCTIGANWPDILPSCETASKSRSQPSGFAFNDVNSGSPFMQMTTTDLPTIFDVVFKFTRDKARIFNIWLNQNKVKTHPHWFEFPIQIEAGLTTQTVKFVEYPQLTSQNGDAFTYSGKLIVRDLVGADEISPIDDFVVDENWPSILPSCETASKSRTNEQGFKVNNYNTAAFAQEFFSDDLPTVWDITFKFRRKQARLFMFWLTENGMREQSKWFEFPIQLEEGLTTQEVRFLSFPQLTSQNGDAFSYSAKIMARELVSCDKDCPEGTIYIIANKNCNQSFDKAAQCFDDALNIGWIV